LAHELRKRIRLDQIRTRSKLVNSFQLSVFKTYNS
jgi:hypothetical protein